MWLSCSRSAECGQSCSGSRCSQDRLQCADTCLQAELQRLQAVAAAATSQTGRRFQFGLYSLYYWRAARRPWEMPLISFGQLLLWLQVSKISWAGWQNISGVTCVWNAKLKALRSYL